MNANDSSYKTWKYSSAHPVALYSFGETHLPQVIKFSKLSISKRGARNEIKRRLLVAVIKGFELSGLSQEEFCSEQGIPITQFKYQWRKKRALVRPKSNSPNTSEQSLHFESIQIRKEDSACLEVCVRRNTPKDMALSLKKFCWETY